MIQTTEPKRGYNTYPRSEGRFTSADISSTYDSRCRGVLGQCWPDKLTKMAHGQLTDEANTTAMTVSITAELKQVYDCHLRKVLSCAHNFIGCQTTVYFDRYVKKSFQTVKIKIFLICLAFKANMSFTQSYRSVNSLEFF